MSNLFQYIGEEIVQKATMKEPQKPRGDSSVWDNEEFRVVYQTYLDYLASLARYFAIGFSEDYRNRDLVEGKDFKLKEQWLLSYGQGSAWFDAEDKEAKGYKNYRQDTRFVAIPIPKEEQLVQEESTSNVKEESQFQNRVRDWMLVCFGKEIAADIQERNHRFIEEALELIQATGATRSECLQLVEYVFNRRVGETNQEIGSVMVTLAALCNAIELSMTDAGETELKRIWTKVDKIREKQAAKPKHSPLPEHVVKSPTAEDVWNFAVKSVKTVYEYTATDKNREALLSDLKRKFFKSTPSNNTGKEQEQDEMWDDILPKVATVYPGQLKEYLKSKYILTKK